MEGIKQEFIQNCVQEDIDFYYNLHTIKTDDLLGHCQIMTDELTRDYTIFYPIGDII
jgi:hypothetical protein